MIRQALVLAAVALPSWSFAAPAVVEFSDGLLEHAVRESDRKLQKVAFERSQLEERTSFLRALKALPPKERAESWRKFRDAQKERESKFIRSIEQRTDQFLERGDA